MNIADTLRGLLRRWYIVLPGIILAMAAGLGAFVVVQPGYERTATQLLLPGEGTVPPGATNPYLYLGGLTQAADIIVQVMKSDEGVGQVVEEYPDTEIVVQRDPTTSGPVIQFIVTAKSDAAAEGALSALVAESAVVLERLQAEQNVTADDQMSISTLTQDQNSTLQQKTRLLASAGVALGLVVLTLLVASLVDGLSRRARRSGRQGGTSTAEGATAAEAAAADDPLLDLGDASGDLDPSRPESVPARGDVYELVGATDPRDDDVIAAARQQAGASQSDDPHAGTDDGEPAEFDEPSVDDEEESSDTEPKADTAPVGTAWGRDHARRTPARRSR